MRQEIRKSIRVGVFFCIDVQESHARHVSTSLTAFKWLSNALQADFQYRETPYKR